MTQNAPHPTEVLEGKTYYWCSCWQSKKQPFCDASHRGTTFRPAAYKATETKKVYFCGYKSIFKQPLCDGTHSGK